MITAKQRECLSFIQGYIDNHAGVSPSMREIAFALNISVGNAWRFVHSLSERGRLKRQLRGHRALEVVGPMRREKFFIWDEVKKALIPLDRCSQIR